MPDFDKLIIWIEAHNTTVDLIKWLLVGLLAWFLGVFRFLRTKLKRPSIEVQSLTSRCAWVDLGEIDGKPANAQVIMLIDVGINNPTASPINVRNFTLQIKRLKKWSSWNSELHPTTLPCRVRQNVGDVTKYLKNWFSNFNEGHDSLSLGSKIEGRDFQSGFLMFVSLTSGNMLPKKVDGNIPIKLKARLTTGETLFAKANIHVLGNNSVLQELVPGVFEYVENPSTWNIIRNKP